MLINLKSSAEKARPQQLKVELNERLPTHINAPCTVDCKFNVQLKENYYIITLDVDSQLSVICQRCLGEFHYHHMNHATLAVCDDDMLERLKTHYECIASHEGRVELNELLTDELHLYVPECHSDLENCDQETEQFIQPSDSETYF